MEGLVATEVVALAMESKSPPPTIHTADTRCRHWCDEAKASSQWHFCTSKASQNPLIYPQRGSEGKSKSQSVLLKCT